jgi:putative membrane protein
VLRNGAPNAEQAPAPASGTAAPSAAASPHQQEVTGGSAKEGGISARSFISKASQDGMTEVKLAELASQKSENDSVKQFASHMASDHSTANSELESVAKEANIPVSDKLDAKHEAEVAALSKKSGAAFDKAYTAAMVKAHKQAVALFKKGAHSSDQNVASFANKTLPTLQSHQRMADDLASQMRVASAGNGGANR